MSASACVSNGVPVSLPIQALTMDKATGAGGTNLQASLAFENGLDEGGNMQINYFCQGRLDWNAVNRPLFWQINLSCVYIYADPTQSKMYEGTFHEHVWVKRLGDARWLSEKPVVPVTPSQLGALMRDQQGRRK